VLCNCIEQETKLVDQLSFPFRYHARDIYVPKYALNFIVARCAYEWRLSSRGEAMNASDRLTFYGAKSFFLLQYSSGKQFGVVGSEFYHCTHSYIFMNGWGIDRVTFRKMPSVT